MTSFEVKETYKDNRPKYSIVVGSNHPEKAFGEFINEFVWEEERLLFFQDSDQGNHKFLEKEWNAENDRRIAIIKPISIEILRKVRPDWISFKDAITKIILELDNIGLLIKNSTLQPHIRLALSRRYVGDKKSRFKKGLHIRESTKDSRII